MKIFKAVNYINTNECSETVKIVNFMVSFFFPTMKSIKVYTVHLRDFLIDKSVRKKTKGALNSRSPFLSISFQKGIGTDA